jgi:hypothetical protein
VHEKDKKWDISWVLEMELKSELKLGMALE